ncbi:modin [Colletotrichum karsti]|uniref:Modin n=1 Tax=Colletotrichum karsti TaxID=1095194 RepID=A0A9P6LP07_9PEZI|nr:modin [Colletotrichum karsti]KAF9880528.1 modin [Colletotrichum karsti]
MTTGMDEAQFNKTLDLINNNINDDDNELWVAIAALVISVVALLASLLQVAQQYYASAAGYSSCDEKAIGKWSEGRQRVLKPYEFRFEVQFEAPVIFLCPPKNERGPVKNADILFIDGSPESLEKTRTALPQAPSKDSSQSSQATEKEIKRAVHTADNELASWVTLLSALQQMEHESREWQQKKYDVDLRPREPPKDNTQINSPEDTKGTLAKVAGKYSLAVALQKKVKSWDTMPSSVKKPYATTTWCHIVEMLALLGIYWVEFDRTNDRYRAEGNGYTVTGSKVSELGIMFTFQVHGRNRFGPNRVVPVDEVKELCFGFVPTIYKSKSDERRLKLPIDESRDLSTLNFATMNEIAETLVLIGCNTNTVRYFSDNKTTTTVSHVFPVAFEIVGMLGQTLHIEKSAFRLLPNPTLFRWDTKNFSLPRLLTAYEYQMRKRFGRKDTNDMKEKPSEFKDARNNVPITSNVTRQISRHIKILQKELFKQASLPTDRRSELSLSLMDALHTALDDTDEILTFRRKENRPVIHREYTTKSKLLRQVSEKTGNVAGEHQETELESDRRETVRFVLRSHIQEVLSGFNPRPGKTTPEATGQKTTTPPSKPKFRFEDIDSAPPEVKQAKLMEVYFRTVRQKVIDESQKSTERRDEELTNPKSAPPAPEEGFALKRAQTGKTIRSPVAPESSGGDSEQDIPLERLPEIDDDDEPIDLLDEDYFYDTTHEDIWCTLVFRMICWLMLHDFHKNDVQLPKSELFGSRLPVYVA